jgi:hypothetical protein
MRGGSLASKRAMRALIASLALVLLVPVPAAAADPCAETGTQLTGWLLPLRQRLWYRAPFLLHPGQTLVAANPDRLTKVSTLPERGYLIELTATDARFEGRVTAEAELGARVKEVIAATTSDTVSSASGFDGDISGGLIGDAEPAPPPRRAPPPPVAADRGPVRVLLAVAPEVAWSRVAATATAARAAGATEIGFVFEVTGRDVPPAGASKIDARLAAITADTDPARKATAARTLLDEVVATCPDARPLVDASNVAYGFADVLLPRCKCAVDLPSLRAFAWFMSYVERPMLTVYAPVAGRKTIKLAIAGKTRWAVAHKQVLAKFNTGRPVVLASR